MNELQVEVETKRLDAIELLGKLFTLPGSEMDQTYEYLFEEFLRRCKDQKVMVMKSLHCARCETGTFDAGNGASLAVSGTVRRMHCKPSMCKDANAVSLAVSGAKGRVHRKPGMCKDAAGVRSPAVWTVGGSQAESDSVQQADAGHVLSSIHC